MDYLESSGCLLLSFFKWQIIVVIAHELSITLKVSNNSLDYTKLTKDTDQTDTARPMIVYGISMHRRLDQNIWRASESRRNNKMRNSWGITCRQCIKQPLDGKTMLIHRCEMPRCLVNVPFVFLIHPPQPWLAAFLCCLARKRHLWTQRGPHRSLSNQRPRHQPPPPQKQ